jgi:thiol-disulfide isomerase/thioredoxin
MAEKQAKLPVAKAREQVATAREQVATNSGGIVVDPRVLLAGGGVALVGLAVLAVFIWMVPNAAAREVRAACNGLRPNPPAANVCGGQPCTLPTLAPDFTAYDYAGNQVRLSDFRGKVVLVNFWASWCNVCKNEKPALESMAGDLTSGDFVVIALASNKTWAEALTGLVESLAPGTPIERSPDGEVTMKAALDAYRRGMPGGTPMNVLLDPPAGEGTIGAIAASWGIKAVPESALIDRQGNLRAYFVNKRDWDSPVAETCLRSLIDE